MQWGPPLVTCFGVIGCCEYNEDLIFFIFIILFYTFFMNSWLSSTGVLNFYASIVYLFSKTVNSGCS